VRSFIRTTLAAALLTLTAACATPGMQRIETGIGDASSTASSSLTIARAQERLPYYEEVDEFWLGADSIEAVRGPALPEAFGEYLVFRRSYPVSLNVVAEHISTQYGLPVAVMPDAIQAAAETSYDPVRELQNRQQILAAGSSGAGAPGASGLEDSRGLFLVQYEGTLRGLLDNVTARTGTSWRYEDGRVRIFALETRVFRVQVIPGSTSLSATVSNQATGGSSSGGGGGEGGGSQNVLNSGNTTDMEATINRFQGVAESIQGMLTAKGRMVAAAGMNTVTVTDTPPALDRIAALVDELNADARRQVLLDVRVYAIEQSSGEDYGIDWSMVYRSLDGRYRIDALGRSDADIDNSGMLVTLMDPTSRIAGSQALVRALSTQGRLSNVTSAAVVTLSGTPVPVQVGEETGYVESSEQTVVPNVGVTTTRTVATVSTGFSMQLLPVLISSEELLLQLQLNLSQLRDLQQFGTDANAVQRPLKDSRQTMQSVRLKTGQTLVLSGFEQDSLRSDHRGIGSPGFQAAGGGRKGTERRTILVITVTPRVLG
jgi:type IVB pilus formation R64 PilN family outer membrane protein